MLPTVPVPDSQPVLHHPHRHHRIHLATQLKGARWALLKNPKNLTYKQAVTLAGIRGAGGQLARAHALKGTTGGVRRRPGTPGRARPVAALVFLGIPLPIPEFVTAGRTPSKNTWTGSPPPSTGACPTPARKASTPSSAPCSTRARGFHSPEAALALIMLACGPRQPTLHTTRHNPHIHVGGPFFLLRIAIVCQEAACRLETSVYREYARCQSRAR